MKQNAIIEVIGTQSVDGQSDTVELTSDGFVETNEKGIRLTYDEGEGTTVLTVVGESVSINRSGEDGMSMVIQKNRRRQCSYPSPMGMLLIGTFCEEMEIEENHIKLKYNLDMNSALMSKNTLEVNIKPYRE